MHVALLKLAHNLAKSIHVAIVCDVESPFHENTNLNVRFNGLLVFKT